MARPFAPSDLRPLQTYPHIYHFSWLTVGIIGSLFANVSLNSRGLTVTPLCSHDLTHMRHLKATFCGLNLSNNICCDCRSSTQRNSTTFWRRLKDTPKRARASKQTFPVISSASWDSQEILWKVQFVFNRLKVSWQNRIKSKSWGKF